MSDPQFPFHPRVHDMDVPAGFEDRVWKKIKKRKITRRTTFALALLLLVAGSFFTLRTFQPANPDRNYTASIQSSPKEEVPLTENLIFAVDDQRNSYSIEPISFNKKAKKNRIEI